MLIAPALGGLWSHPLSHFAIAALVLPVAAFALRRGFRAHGRRWVVALGALGIVLVSVGAALPYLVDPVVAAGGCEGCDQCCPSIIVDEVTGEERLHIPPASIVTLFGGIALVSAHIANLRCCSNCAAASAAL